MFNKSTFSAKTYESLCNENHPWSVGKGGCSVALCVKYVFERPNCCLLLQGFLEAIPLYVVPWVRSQ